jgi:membrane protein YqaA with SNARE-associated domain
VAKIRRRWLMLTLYGTGLITLSIALAYLLQYLIVHFNISLGEFAPGAYFAVFIISFLCNASILVPVVALHISIMMTAASQWDPILVAFIASAAGTLGEISGYYAGYLGKKIAITRDIPGYNRFVDWVNRYGVLAIFLFSLQPILPFDIAGLTAGVSRLPLWKFLLPCWAGKFPKYIVFCYFGFGLLHFLPLWFQPLG